MADVTCDHCGGSGKEPSVIMSVGAGRCYHCNGAGRFTGCIPKHPLSFDQFKSMLAPPTIQEDDNG